MPETYADIKKLIRESATFSGGKDFSIKELAAEIGLSFEFINQVISEMAQDGQVSKKRARTPGLKGSGFYYRKCGFRPRDFLAMSFRRHSNEQLHLTPLHTWAVM